MPTAPVPHVVDPDDPDEEFASAYAASGSRRWWIIGIVGCLVGTALVTWLAVANTVGQVTWVVTGYTVVSESEVDVQFDVHDSPGTAAVCTVEALDARFGRVGRVEVQIPASAERVTSHQATIRTSSRAVTGTVASCAAAP